MNVVWHNRCVSVAKDRVFGLSVLDTEDGWVPLTQLDLPERVFVRELIAGDTSFPWKDELAALCEPSWDLDKDYPTYDQSRF
jgi:hypothetical protein